MVWCIVASVGIPEPIRQSMRILATHRALFGRRGNRRGARAMSEADVARVIRVFKAKRARWALVGAHAIGLVTEPRATADFDFVLDASKFDDVIRALTKEFGPLDERDIGAAVQLTAIDVDLIRSTEHPLFEAALEHRRIVGGWRVPRTEVLIVLKFMAAVSPRRNRDRRRQDVADIGFVYHAAEGKLDRALMRELSRLVYPGAEAEFQDLIGKIDRDEPIAI
jgi:hypothetical protein